MTDHLKKQEVKIEDLLTQKELCDLLKISTATAEGWRFYGRGPAFIRLSPRCIRYRKSDVFNYMAENTITPVS